MRQLTLRVPEDLAADLRRAAAERGESMNSWATLVLRAAVDPELAGDAAAQVRERLRRAGLLADASVVAAARDDPETVARARAQAGRGRPLSAYVSEGRD